MTDTISAAAAALRAGTTSARVLVETSLAAIDLHQARTNAFISVDADGARRAAEAADEERARGIDRGPLHGIPMSVKDIVDAAGVVTSAGSRVLFDRVPSRDATLLRRLRDAGAIVIGRTNLHEFALGTTSDDSAFGPVRHPMDPTRSPGGSSGGSAAAVTTGMGLASIGTDTGGSIRIPSAICGLVGLKPAYGEVPTDGVIPLSTSFDHAGPLARCVQDAAWICDVLAGRPATLVAPARPTGLRLGLLGGYFAGPLDPAVRAAFERALARLAEAGVDVDQKEIERLAGIHDTYVSVMLPEGAHWHAPYLDTRRDLYTPTVGARLAHGRTIPAVDYLAGRDRCTALRHAVDDVLQDVDALVLPTLPIVAPPIGLTDTTIDPAQPQTTPVRIAMLKHTQLFNMTGHPAISLPIQSDGLPVGLQLVARSDGTRRLVEIAAACEAIFTHATGRGRS